MSDLARARWVRLGRLALPGGLALGLALNLAACAAGPDYQRPPPPAARGYVPPEARPPERVAEEAQRIALGRGVPARWWTLFRSPRLDETLRHAIGASRTLVAARATLAQAQEAVVQARAGLYPQADLDASARRTGAAGKASNLFSVGPIASYSLDVFGGTRRRVEQETALAEYQRYQVGAAYLALTGNCVVEAITIASTRFQIATVEDVIKNDERNVDLVQRQFDAGKVAKNDVLVAAAQLASDRTQLPALRQQLSVARHALSVLEGRAPGDGNPPDFDIGEFTLPNDLPVSLPSELVRQRPDILAVEAQLHADGAAIGVAEAQLFPSITLSASLVEQALSLATLFASKSATWALGAAADQPLFRGGALLSQKRAAVDAYDAMLATYQQTVLQAFGQVADVLCALDHDAEMVAVSRAALDTASASLKLQRSTYEAGKTSALQLIAAENTYSNASVGYARAMGQRLVDTAQLLVAVGGGWWNEPGLDAMQVVSSSGRWDAGVGATATPP